MKAGDLEVRVLFEAVKELAVNILVETLFMVRDASVIFAFHWKIALQKPRPVYVTALKRRTENLANIIGTGVLFTVMKNRNKHKIRVARQKVILPRLESSWFVMFIAATLQIIKSKTSTRGRALIVATRGVANILTLVPLYILVTSFFKTPNDIRKNMLMAHGEVELMQVSRPSGPYLIVTEIPEENAVCKPAEISEFQVEKHENGTEPDNERLEQDWREEVKTANAYIKYNEKSL